MSATHPERGVPDVRRARHGRPDVRVPDQGTIGLAGPGREATAVSARLDHATWPEVEAAAGGGPTTLLVPLGATEQHGPHLPLGTDSDIAGAVARTAAARLPGAVVAPTLPYGASGEHQDFAGTLSIGTEALGLVLVELGRSATETFERLLFVNAHGGNAGSIANAVARLRDEGRDVRAWTPRFGGDAHAGRTETSLMLALAPEHVRGRPNQPPPRGGRPNPPIAPVKTTTDEGAPVRTTALPGNDAPLAELIGRLRAEGVRAVSPNGVLGDPTDASAVEGRLLLAAAVEDLCATVRSWPAPALEASR